MDKVVKIKAKETAEGRLKIRRSKKAKRSKIINKIFGVPGAFLSGFGTLLGIYGTIETANGRIVGEAGPYFNFALCTYVISFTLYLFERITGELREESNDIDDEIYELKKQIIYSDGIDLDDEITRKRMKTFYSKRRELRECEKEKWSKMIDSLSILLLMLADAIIGVSVIGDGLNNSSFEGRVLRLFGVFILSLQIVFVRMFDDNKKDLKEYKQKILELKDVMHKNDVLTRG